MALGYEGLIKLGTHYVLGTGGSVPRTIARMDSSSGYGGTINTPATMGIGAPYNFDWTPFDGSISFEMTQDVFTSEVKWWLFNRQTLKPIVLQSRKDNVQQFDTCFFNSISISTSEGSVVDCSIGFSALERNSYVWGSLYKNNRKGSLVWPLVGLGPACTAPADLPPPLNPSSEDKNPIPYWKTSISVGGTVKNFTNWSLDFTQEVVKFFGCTDTASALDPLAQEPLYIAAGPMTGTFSGSYMDDFTGGANGFLGDYIAQVVVNIGTDSITLKKLSATTEYDDVQTAETQVPLTVDYAVYGIQ